MSTLSWLDKGELFQTSDQEVACDIEQIRELLEEDENDPNTKEHPTC